MKEKSKIIEEIQQDRLRLLSLKSEFKNSDTENFYLELRENRTMIYLLQSNFCELNNTLKLHDNLIEYSNFHSNIKIRHKLQRKITRQFSNYLNSLFSIVDYNRRNVEKLFLRNPIENQKYNERKELFKKNKYHIFIKDLRNYSAHFTYLKIGSEIDYSGHSVKPTKSIIIYKNDLLMDASLSNKTKDIISEMPDKIRLNDILFDHYNAFVEFQNYTFLQIFLIDIKRTENFIAKMNEYYLNVESINSTGQLFFDKSFLSYLDYVYMKAKKYGK